MNPIFFGPAHRRLYGVHHPASSNGEAGGERAILLCPPAPQEYMTTHWAYRRLANMLAKAGADVLRFDYFGMGNSAGEEWEATLRDFQDDILVAAEELSRLTGSERISLVGYRLGAALAWRASLVSQAKPKHLVLWDPVVSGLSYVSELDVAHRAMFARLLRPPRFTEASQELLGHSFTSQMRSETQAIDLLRESLPAATRVHLYYSRTATETARLEERLAKDLKRFSSQFVPEEGARGSGSLLSNRVLQVIRAALASTSSSSSGASNVLMASELPA